MIDFNKLKIVRHAYMSYNKYKNLPCKNESTLYYICDTRDIYRGEELFNRSIIKVDELPTDKISNSMIYVYNGDMYYRVNDQWEMIDIAANIEFAPDTSDENNDKAVSVSLMKQYISSILEDITAKNRVFNNMELAMEYRNSKGTPGELITVKIDGLFREYVINIDKSLTEPIYSSSLKVPKWEVIIDESEGE